MDVADDVGPCEREQVIVSCHLPRLRGQDITTEILFLQTISLNHCAHGAIQHQDASLLELLLQGIE